MQNVMKSPTSLLLGSVASCLVVAGCSGSPGRVATPTIDADDVTQAALEFYDKNSDGQLDPQELRQCPALIDAMSVYDANKDGTLTGDEMIAGVNSWAARGIGAMALSFTVRLDGRPLEGAQIALTPVAFLADYVAPATGSSDATGSGTLRISEEDRPPNVPANLPVIQPGLYSVQITHPTVSVPARYNTATTLGLEAGIAGQNPAGVTWELSTKK